MDRVQAETIYAAGKEAVILALLEQAAKIQQLQACLEQLNNDRSPSTPSGMIPPYEKASTTKRGRKRPGRKKGHPGARRPRICQEAITQTNKHLLHACPDCHGPVTLLEETRDRYTEDIPEEKPQLTRHIQQMGWCATCKKKVVAVVTDALPGATIGNRALVLTAWLHYGLGTTLSHILQVFNAHFHFPLTRGGLIQMWARLAEILYPWYLYIIQEARSSAYLHADETGWRVNGVTHWLWCFTNKRLSCYLIHRCRGSPVLAEFFGELFSGILISDFWGAYNKLEVAARQVCFVHLFRELEKVAKTNQAPEWLAFRKKLGRFLRDALRLDKNHAFNDQDRTNRMLRLHQRLDLILDAHYHDPDCKRLVARLNKHREHILTFLETDIPADNNHAEREIRPAVIIRKNSYGNKSQHGAEIQAVMMSIYRTLKLRGLEPLETITAALKTYIETGILPPVPESSTAIG